MGEHFDSFVFVMGHLVGLSPKIYGIPLFPQVENHNFYIVLHRCFKPYNCICFRWPHKSVFIFALHIHIL